jgi:hypothetical protein
MRTLRALRYLDRPTAIAFSKILPMTFAGRWLPNDPHFLGRFGVNADLLLDVNDAGLLATKDSLYARVTGGFDVGLRRVRVTRKNDPPGGPQPHGYVVLPPVLVTIPTYPLTRAGEELARVAEISFDLNYFLELLKWIASRDANLVFTWAELPHRGWTGRMDHLTWNPLQP